MFATDGDSVQEQLALVMECMWLPACWLVAAVTMLSMQVQASLVSKHLVICRAPGRTCRSRGLQKVGENGGRKRRRSGVRMGAVDGMSSQDWPHVLYGYIPSMVKIFKTLEGRRIESFDARPLLSLTWSRMVCHGDTLFMPYLGKNVAAVNSA